MKQTLILFTTFCLLISCKQTDRGAADTETLSKKLFDTLRDNDIQKSSMLLPDKGTFRKIEEEKGMVYDDIELAYQAFSQTAEANFHTVQLALPSWENTVYARSTKIDAKFGKLPTSKVSAKFDADGEAYKFEFTAVKFNNRWFYYGDATWVAKTKAI